MKSSSGTPGTTPVFHVADDGSPHKQQYIPGWLPANKKGLPTRSSTAKNATPKLTRQTPNIGQSMSARNVERTYVTTVSGTTKQTGASFRSWKPVVLSARHGNLTSSRALVRTKCPRDMNDRKSITGSMSCKKNLCIFKKKEPPSIFHTL